jgi:hypothetical protein
VKALANMAVMIVLTLGLCWSQDDADTYLKVEKARAEVLSCRKLLETSDATRLMELHLMTYADLDKHSNQLSHCAYVFRMTGDAHRLVRAVNESGRYDAIAAEHMMRYIRGKKLWDDFLKQDCRLLSTKCGS